MSQGGRGQRRVELAARLGQPYQPGQPVGSLAHVLPHRPGHVLVPARRDQDVAVPMRDYIGERGDWLAGLMRIAQADGEVDPALSPNALAHFCLLLAMGSALITPELHAVEDGEWSRLLSRVVRAFAPISIAAETGTRCETPD